MKNEFKKNKKYYILLLIILLVLNCSISASYAQEKSKSNDIPVGKDKQNAPNPSKDKKNELPATKDKQNQPPQTPSLPSIPNPLAGLGVGSVGELVSVVALVC